MATPTTRLDTFLSNLWLVPRRQAAKIVKAGMVLVDGEEVVRADMKVSYGQVVTYFGAMLDGEMREEGVEIEVKDLVYVLLHKSAGYVCSELDEGWHLSYKNLLMDCPYAGMLHVAGRLDQDTEWLVLCSNDGQWTHQIISPKKHLEKEYFLRTQAPVSVKDIATLENGVAFLPGYPGGWREEWYVTMPAIVHCVDSNGERCAPDDAARDRCALRLVITEGKYHQVKRMLQAVGNEVTYLRRDRVGERTLEGVELGKWKYLDIGKE